jgi:hypothetical protein
MRRATPRTLGLLIAGAAAFLSIQPAIAQDSRDRLAIAAVPHTPLAGDFTLAAVGDLIYLRPMLATIEKQSPDMLRILRGADVTFANRDERVRSGNLPRRTPSRIRRHVDAGRSARREGRGWNGHRYRGRGQ